MSWVNGSVEWGDWMGELTGWVGKNAKSDEVVVANGIRMKKRKKIWLVAFALRCHWQRKIKSNGFDSSCCHFNSQYHSKRTPNSESNSPVIKTECRDMLIGLVLGSACWTQKHFQISSGILEIWRNLFDFEMNEFFWTRFKLLFEHTRKINQNNHVCLRSLWKCACLANSLSVWK